MSLSSRRRRITAVAALAVLSLFAGACGNAEGGSDVATANGVSYDLSPEQPGRVHAQRVDEIAALVPQAIRDRGTLVVTGSAGAAPPLRFYATDDKTVVGSEIDFAAVIADVLGLKLDARVADWAQNFVKVDSGEVDLFVSNVTVTEERKEKYDFATYRQDRIALEIPEAATWTYTDRKSLAGKKIGVGSGTNQEQLLVKWNEENVAEGLPRIEIQYFQQVTDYYLGLSSGRLDGYIGPNPTAQYHAATAKQTKVIQTFSGAGDVLQAEIAVLTKKDNGLVTAIHKALQQLISDGTYQQVIDRWGLKTEAVSESRVNPPGLPKKKG
ncbi:ABC transporter substrate-binding protein [Nocardia sp. 2]|uniref:ABC transporter substrate-binding protein n=1 Tax=Nocardia acididurans TaxID=2802282 RepID=A0ABS1LZJ0_9NOCA|nr:ABC transporter substrate-binding protein [Nocardia acididurans]MBL1073476.1 ABC transporter substrate-binding protein [Nocardia acididurans]